MSDVFDPDGYPYDQIHVTGMSAFGHHGVNEHEREFGQMFSADVVLHMDVRSAATTDDIVETVNYADVAVDVVDAMGDPALNLIESVADRIAHAVLTLYEEVEAIDVTLHKPHAQLSVPFSDVSVHIRRIREGNAAAEAVTPQPTTPRPRVPKPVRQTQGTEDAVRPTVKPRANRRTDSATDGGVTVRTVNRAPAAQPKPKPAPHIRPGIDDKPVARIDAGSEPAQRDPGDVVMLDQVPGDPVEVVLALGSNMGDSHGTLRRAISDIAATPGINIMAVSPLVCTKPVGSPEDTADFLNAVVVAWTTLSPNELLTAIAAMETGHGRLRDMETRWGSRTLDVDIITYGPLVASSDTLTIPHLRAGQRAFVLFPWAQVRPDAILPGPDGGPVSELAESAPDRNGIQWLALDWLSSKAPTHIPVAARGGGA